MRILPNTTRRKDTYSRKAISITGNADGNDLPNPYLNLFDQVFIEGWFDALFPRETRRQRKAWNNCPL